MATQPLQCPTGLVVNRPFRQTPKCCDKVRKIFVINQSINQ